MALGQIVPGDFFVSPRDLSLAVVGGRIPLHLPPSPVDSQVLNKGEAGPPAGVGTVAVVAQTGEIGGCGEVAEQTTKDGESDW